MNCLIFDIETIPDVELGRRIFALEGLSDAAVAKAMFAHRRQESGRDFLPLEQHRVIAIACALRSREELRLWSLGAPAADEKELIERFFDGIEKYSPDLCPGTARALICRCCTIARLRTACRPPAIGKRATPMSPFATTTI
jgi:predicted PolB exonuclease-like 3'-5' exonuclease